MKTKTKLLCMSMLAIFQLSAADIYVNQSGQAGTYLTISDAVAAASDGDNIYISPIAEYIEDVTIDKSLTFASAETTNDYFMEGSMTVVGAPDRYVRFIQGEFATLNYNSGTASFEDKTKITLRTTTVTNNIDLGSHNSLELNVLYCAMPSKTLTFQFGKVIGSKFYSINTIGTPPYSNYVIDDTTFIIGNEVNNQSTLACATHYLFIAGNYFNKTTENIYKILAITADLSSGSGGNYICNNEFYSTGGNYSYNNSQYGLFLGLLESGNFSNFKIYNNKFYCGGVSSSISQSYRTMIGLVNSGGISQAGTLSASDRPDIKYNVSTLTTWPSTNHNILYGVTNHSSNQTTTQMYSNTGAPTIDFYDINMTRNDVGRYGGPYTKQNYSSYGGQRIYHLEMPFQLLPGETPNIKAEAVHD